MKRALSKIQSSSQSAEITLPDQVYLIDLMTLKEHEQIRPEYLEQLKDEILSDRILKMPIAVDKTTYTILDEHHRLHALKKNRVQEDSHYSF